MTPKRAAADRRVINAAKQIQLAQQYGINPTVAVREYDRARAEQARASRDGAQ